MQFPQRDLTGQHISTSYQDVVQRYLNGGVDYLLDGLGFVIAGIPETSIGNIIVTQDQTASFASTASFALNVNSNASVSSSWASQSLSSSFSQTASFALNAGSGQISSSWASASFTSISASYARMSDIAQVADVALMADTASISVDSINSSFATTASFASVASNAFNSISASFASQSISASWAPPSGLTAFAVSASFASQSLSASWAPVPISASWASASLSSSISSKSISASFSSVTISSSYSDKTLTSSFANVSISSSFASQAISASWAPPQNNITAVSSSWASQSLSSSVATTASFALNGGGAILQVDTIAADYTVSSSNNNHLIQCVSNLNITLPNIGIPSTIYVSLIGNVTVGFLTGSGMAVFGQTSITGDGTFVTCVQTNSTTWEIFGSSATPKTLYSNLIAFWAMDQSPFANLLDSYGFHGLAPTVTTSSIGTGLTRKIATVLSGSQNYISGVTNDADAKFNFGDTDFSISSWVFPMSSSTNITRMLSRFDTTTNKRVYTLAFDPSIGKFEFAINNTGLVANTFIVTSDAFGTASYNNWYNVIGYHDSTRNIIGIWVNSVETTASWSSGSFSTTGVAMNIGGLNNTGSSFAKLQDIGVWGKVLSTSEKSLLYNSGRGLTYPFII